MDRLRAEIDRAFNNIAPKRQLVRAHPWPNGETLPSGGSLSDFVAYMPMDNYIFMPDGTPWPAASVDHRLPGIPYTDKQGAEKQMAPSMWLDKNSPVEQMTWCPGKPAIIRNHLILEGGLVDRDGVAIFNLYKPPVIEPGDPEKATRWLDHVCRVFPDDVDHFLAWCAHKVQHPEIKINHALVLGGEQGIGKDTVLEPVKYAVAHWNFKEINPVQVKHRLNPSLKSVILRISEGRDLGEVDRYQFYDHLKDYIAAPRMFCASMKRTYANTL